MDDAIDKFSTGHPISRHVSPSIRSSVRDLTRDLRYRTAVKTIRQAMGYLKCVGPEAAAFFASFVGRSSKVVLSQALSSDIKLKGSDRDNRT